MVKYYRIIFVLYINMIETFDYLAERFNRNKITERQRGLTGQYSDLLITPIMTLTRLSCERNARDIDEQCYEKLEVNRSHEI